MPVDLKNRPDEDTGDSGIHPDWYQPGSDPLEDAYNAPSATDDDLPEGHPSRQSLDSKAVSSQELQEAERSGATQTPSGVEKNESASTLDDDTIGEGYKDISKKRFLNLTTKQKISGSIAALLIGGGFWGFSILQGPLQIIHAAQMLQNFHFASNNESSSSRIGRVYEFFRTGNDPSKRNLGFMGEKLSEKYISDLSKDGVSLEFEAPNGRLSRRIQSMRIDPEHPKGSETIDRLRQQGINVGDDGLINMREDGLNAKQRRRVLNTTVDLQDKGKISSAVSKRLLALRAGVDFHPFRNIRKDAQESFADFYRERRAERSEKVKDGVDARAGTRLEGDQEPDPDAEDPNVTRENPVAGEIADEVENAAREAAAVDSVDARRSLSQRVLGSAGGKAAGVAGAIVGTLCAVKAVGDSIGPYKHANIVLPMMRMSMMMISMGSQLQTGQDINLDELGEVVDTMHNDEFGSFFGAAGMQAVAGAEINGPDTDVKPSDANEKPELFNIIDGIPLLGGACSVSDGIGRIVNTVTFGLADRATETLVEGALGIFGTSQEALMDRLLAVLSGDLVDTLATGTILGNYVAIGGRLAANDAALAAGGRALNTGEFAAIKNTQDEQLKEEYLQKSFFARTFDINDSNSVVAQAAIDSPNLRNEKNILSNLARLPNTFAGLFSSTFNQLTPKSIAQSSETYDFGVEAYGFSQAELENPDFADPYAIADYVEPKLSELNGKYGDCFANQVEPTTFALTVGESPDYEKVTSGECNDGSQDLLYYRYYLLDTTTIRSAACFEGVDDIACQEIGFGGRQATPTTNAGPAGSATAPCSIGTPYLTDGRGATSTDGIFMTGANHDTPIRICVVQGFPVNVTIEAAVNNLVNAATQAGVSLTVNSAFRSYEHQIELRKQNCGTSDYAIFEMPVTQCEPDTAKPGTSNHEDGLAIDFANCGSRGTACYQWLASNAAQFGFDNYDPEPWHWSMTGN